MKYAVYVYYPYADKGKGEVLSTHFTYQAAEIRARSNFLGIKEVPDHIKKGDNINSIDYTTFTQRGKI